MTLDPHFCRNGHAKTGDNVILRMRGDRESRECRACSVISAGVRYGSVRRLKKLNNGEGRLSPLWKATLTREDMLECWSCLESPVTGRRGRMGVDEDGHAKCFACGRVQQVTVEMEGA